MDSKIVKRDIDHMLESIEFENVIRYRHDPAWDKENKLQDLIDSKNYKRLESDADHSWHLADMVLLIGPHFPNLDLDKAIKFAILHDKLEIFIGDDIAVGLSGTGKDSHAFNNQLKLRRNKREEKALIKYLKSLPEDTAAYQKELFAEYYAKATPESIFVNALDKMQVFIRVLYAKKNQRGLYGGRLHKDWLEFAETYHKPRISQVPGLVPYYDELLRRIKNLK